MFGDYARRTIRPHGTGDGKRTPIDIGQKWSDRTPVGLFIALILKRIYQIRVSSYG